LQEKKKTLPLSGTSHRLLSFLLYAEPSMRTSHQPMNASFSAELPVIRGRGRSHASSCLFVRDQETSCASHFRPCWQECRPQEGHEVAVVTLFMPEREDLDPCRALPRSFFSLSLHGAHGGLTPLPVRQRCVTPVSKGLCVGACGVLGPTHTSPPHTWSPGENRRESARSDVEQSRQWRASCPGSPRSGRRSL
jgi:hypothetical protein